MPDWKFALERFTDAVAAMRRAQRFAKSAHTPKAVDDVRAIEARVDELVTEAVEALRYDDMPPVPPLVPDTSPIDAPPLPMPTNEIDLLPAPPAEVEQFDIPPVPPLDAPAIAAPPADVVKQKRGRRRGGQQGGYASE